MATLLLHSYLITYTKMGDYTAMGACMVGEHTHTHTHCECATGAQDKTGLSAVHTHILTG